MEKLKFAYFGTPFLAKQTLEALASAGYLPEIIITSPDKPAGRGLNLTESPVSLWAKNHQIKCLKPEKIRSEFIDEFKKYKVDLSIVVAYGKILPEILINEPVLGTINIHYSLLPKYRGASPLEATLLNGETLTGVSLQQMQYQLDSGPILDLTEIEISLEQTKDQLRETLTNLGSELLIKTLPKIINKNINPIIQDESKATFCKKIIKEDGEIDLEADPLTNYNKYRAYAGWPGIYFYARKGNLKIRVKINEAEYQSNQFIIKKVTPEGKKKIDYELFLKQINISK